MIENDLRLALDRLADNGRRIDFWLRDDDAVEPTEQLAKLATMADAFSVPATLAVIPEMTGADLASYLDTQPHLDVAVHGWSHR
ncbi:MAG: polysaccharide deacetylase, partial [Oxalobacteraceae bacterium]